MVVAPNLSSAHRVERIRVITMNDQPFYGRIACSLRWHLSNDPGNPTVCTDGSAVWWDEEFIKTQSDDNLRFISIHEIQHVIKRHPWRRNGRNPLLWNIACDYAVNLEIVKWGAGKLPEKDGKPAVLYDERFEGMLEEHIYDLLLEEANWIEYTGITGSFGNPNPGETEAEAERRIDEMIEAAYKHAQDAGKTPGWLQNFINKNRQAQVNWRAFLRMQIEPLFPRDISWATPNRRMITSGIYVPGPKKDGAAEIAILIDTSGSVSHEQISAFLAEINSIVSSVSPSKVQVHWFESHVWRSDYLNCGQLLQIPDEVQQGGTNFEAAFAAVEGSPRVIICLTDMYDSFNFPPPRARTIWVATSEEVAPWGTTVPIRI